MLHELRIENLLLIERAELRLGPGLNAITGETGAGKTILAHSLDLLMGGRARPHIVRPGADEAYVEGVFAVPEGLFGDPELAEFAARLPDEREEIVLGRRVGASGRTSAFVQGRAASAADLRALGGRLLAFYGQHEHRKLTLASAQLDVLDAFAGERQLDRRREYRAAHMQVRAAEREIAELREREGVRERDLDLQRFELEEIEAARLDPAEESELVGERERLRHAEGLRAAAGGALGRLAGADDGSGGASGLIAEAKSDLAATEGVDAALDRIAERVSALNVEVGDAAGELRSYLEAVEAEPGRLEELEERLDVVDRLKRKHGGTIDAVLAHAESCRERIESLEGADERAAELEARVSEATAWRAKLGEAMSRARSKAAKGLEKCVAEELDALAMDGAKLEVSLERHPEGFGTSGGEVVEFRLATNPGMPVSPLRDAASGGELSRVMLALTTLGPGAGAGTVVFDEIDAGIGGNTARAVGERLRQAADERQVLCITHLPHVASAASTHFRIEKHVEGGESRATVERVEGEDLVAEICRMLGADRGDDAASRHARELLAAA